MRDDLARARCVGWGTRRRAFKCIVCVMSSKAGTAKTPVAIMAVKNSAQCFPLHPQGAQDSSVPSALLAHGCVHLGVSESSESPPPHARTRQKGTGTRTTGTKVRSGNMLGGGMIRQLSASMKRARHTTSAAIMIFHRASIASTVSTCWMIDTTGKNSRQIKFDDTWRLHSWRRDGDPARADQRPCSASAGRHCLLIKTRGMPLV